MIRAETAGRAFAVNDEFFHYAPDDVLFNFRDIVGNIVENGYLSAAFSQDFAPDLSDFIGDDLAIRPGKIGSRSHSGKIALSPRRLEWRASQLPVRQINAIVLELTQHHPNVVSGDLVPQSARAAVDEDGDLVGK